MFYIIPLLNTVRANKRKVTIITVGDKYNPAIKYFADEQISFDDIINQEIDASGLIIKNLIDDKLLKSICNRVDSMYCEYITDKKNGKNARYKHHGLEYSIEKNFVFYNIMEYEFANTIKILSLDEKILFYNYNFGNDVYIGIIPTDCQEKFIKESIIKDSDIINFNIQLLIDNIYNKYLK